MTSEEVMQAVVSLIRPGIWQPMHFTLNNGKVILGVVRGVHGGDSDATVDILDASTESVVRIPLEDIQRVEIRLRE